MPDNAHERNLPDQIRNKRFFRRRIVIGLLAFTLVGGVLAGRLFQLQIWDYGYYSQRLQNNRENRQPLPAARGLIYDRGGVVLADNQPIYDVAVQPDQSRHLKRVVHRLSQWIKLSPSQLAHFDKAVRTRPSFDPIVLQRNLNSTTLARIEVRKYTLPGVKIKAGLRRYYPLGATTAPVVGYMGDVTLQYLRSHPNSQAPSSGRIGAAGIEARYQPMLQGKPGVRTVEVNARGRVLRTLNNAYGHSGDNLYLTLDSHLQQVAMKAMGSSQGAVVALDPNTGGVLVLASTPSFNPNAFNQPNSKALRAIVDNPHHPLIDRAIGGLYPPGSTIKPVMAIAGLNTDHGKYIHRRYDGGYFTLPHSRHRWWGWDHYGLGWVNLHKAIMESSDIYFYELAHDLGIQRIHHYLNLFGFGRKTGIDLPGESAGVAPSPRWKEGHIGQPWYPGDTVNVGIGQGYLLVTPLQLAQMVSRVAMHGRGWKPHLIRAVQNPKTGQLRYVKPQPLPTIKLADPGDWSRVISGMEAVVDNPHGTAHGIDHNLPFRVAGKTGTSQLTKSKQDKHPDALFICFAPVGHPQIAVAVVIRHGGEGGDAAADVARKVLMAFYREHAHSHRPLPHRLRSTSVGHHRRPVG